MAEAARSMPRQAPHNSMACGGRPIRVPLGKFSVRQLLRRHLREDGRRMQDLAAPWQCAPRAVYDMFCSARTFSLQHIDAAELRLRGAREAGWNIDPTLILETT